MQVDFDLTQFYFNCLLKTNFLENTLGNLTRTFNFVDFFDKQKRLFILKKFEKDKKK